VPGSPGHVMYVWVDALTTYMTGVGYPQLDGEYARRWPADIHLIGKDIVRFHAVYWPAFLMSASCRCPNRSSRMASCSAAAARRCPRASARRRSDGACRALRRRRLALLPAA
jgi:hypothetical protein